MATIRRYLEPLQSRPCADGLLVSVGPADAPPVGIRAELDALPIAEASGSAWASQVPGVAHLCGHDVHMAALAAVLQTVSALTARADGTDGTYGTDMKGMPRLVGVFQPREETADSGARDLIADGELLAENLTAMLGVHLQPSLPAGVMSAHAGVVNAANDSLVMTIHGRAGHAAYPQLTRDPIVAAASFIQSLQHLVSRRLDPMRPGVVSLSSIHGGSTDNAIPGQVRLTGTIRSVEPEDRADLLDQTRMVAKGVGIAHDCQISVHVERGEPVLRNDPALAGRVALALTGAGLLMGPSFSSCGSDDFAYYGEHLPSLMMFLGTGDAEPGSPGLHHPAFVPDDAAVGEVAQTMLAALLAAPPSLSTANQPDRRDRRQP